MLITGGCGFVGSRLAHLFLQKYPQSKVTVFDNLKRRGSELNLLEFKRSGIHFEHGDIRESSDLESLTGNYDLLVEASAEPSVLAGLNGNTRYVVQTNLNGTINTLDFCRKNVGTLIFLSTSRVYSLEPLQNLKLEQHSDRLSPTELNSKITGFEDLSIAENFSVSTARSLYGTTKLASEYFIQEYVNNFKLNAVINRCGVIAGAGQFGKVDQGVFTLWVANHYFKKPLSYTGYGGQGLQVRDLLHPSDLFSAIVWQIENIAKIPGETFNLGGGSSPNTSVSLKEMTLLCQEVTGNTIEITSKQDTSPMDIPWYATNYKKFNQVSGWHPKINAKDIVHDIYSWIKREESVLKALF